MAPAELDERLETDESEQVGDSSDGGSTGQKADNASGRRSGRVEAVVISDGDRAKCARSSATHIATSRNGPKRNV